MIRSNLKSIIDERKISIRKLSRDIDHEYPTVRKLYNDEMEREEETATAFVVSAILSLISLPIIIALTA